MDEEKYNKMISYAYEKFKEAKKESDRNMNIMEYWFLKALKLKEPDSKLNIGETFEEEEKRLLEELDKEISGLSFIL